MTFAELMEHFRMSCGVLDEEPERELVTCWPQRRPIAPDELEQASDDFLRRMAHAKADIAGRLSRGQGVWYRRNRRR